MKSFNTIDALSVRCLAQCLIEINIRWYCLSQLLAHYIRPG